MQVFIIVAGTNDLVGLLQINLCTKPLTSYTVNLATQLCNDDLAI